jgi:integrase
MKKPTETIKISEYVTAKLHPDSGVWYVQVPTLSGESKEVSTGIKGGRAELRAWVKEHKIKESAATVVHTRSSRAVLDVMLTGRKVTWDIAISEWLDSLEIDARSPATIKNYKYMALRFIEEMDLADKSPRDVTERIVFDWINAESPPIHLHTRELYRNVTRSLFSFLQTRRYIIHNPAATVKILRGKLSHEQLEPRHVQAFSAHAFARLVRFIQEDIDQFEEALDNNTYRGARRDARAASLERRLQWSRFWLCASHLAYAIGLRISDIAQLEWASLARQGWVIVHSQKTSARIAIPYARSALAERLAEPDVKRMHPERKLIIESALNLVSPILREAIRLTQKHQGEDMDPIYCFPSAAETYERNRPTLSRSFGGLLNRAGFNGLSFHSLRHSRIRDWDDKGIDLETIGSLVGHASTKTTEGYLGKGKDK